MDTSMLFSVIELNASVWAACAATASAVTAFLLLRIHQHNSAQAVRPELVLDSLCLHNEGLFARICVHSIRNVGNGPVLNLRCQSRFILGVTEGEGIRVWGVRQPYTPIIEPGGQLDVFWSDAAAWQVIKNAQQPNESEQAESPIKQANLDIVVTCLDSHGRTHEFTFSYWLTNSKGFHPAAQCIVEGIYQTGSDHRVLSISYRLRRRIHSILRRGLKRLGWVKDQDRGKGFVWPTPVVTDVGTNGVAKKVENHRPKKSPNPKKAR